MTPARCVRSSRAVRGFDRPGAFPCTIRRALGLRKHHREVSLLKQIQGHTLKEIAAILGISIETARVRLKPARREIGHLGDSDATGHAR